jgi:hypothetical protein
VTGDDHGEGGLVAAEGKIVEQLAVGPVRFTGAAGQLLDAADEGA